MRGERQGEDKKVLNWSIRHLIKVCKSCRGRRHPSDCREPPGGCCPLGWLQNLRRIRPSSGMAYLCHFQAVFSTCCPWEQGHMIPGKLRIHSLFLPSKRETGPSVLMFRAGFSQTGFLVPDPLHLSSVDYFCGPMDHMLEHP